MNTPLPIASFRLLAAAAITIPNLITGCASADKPWNPSFPVTVAQAKEAIREMQANPRPFSRPVVVCAGIFDPGPGVSYTANLLRSMTPDRSQVIEVAFWTTPSFDECRARVIEKLESKWPSTDERRTVDVDVIGVSMGGLVSRYTATPVDGAKRVAIKRLFTLGSPHHGAAWWDVATWDQRARSMRPGSPFMRRLDEAYADPDPNGGGGYEVVAYVRLGDMIVGESNAVAPFPEPGSGRVWWVANRPSEFAHMQAFSEPRFLADIARRLRGEEPLTREPPQPLPSGAQPSIALR